MKKILILAIVFSLFASISNASASGLCVDHYCPSVKITDLNTYTNGTSNIYVATDGDESKLITSTCTPAGNIYFQLDMSAENSNADAVYSVLLAATLNDLTVSIVPKRTNNPTEGCFIQNIQILK